MASPQSDPIDSFMVEYKEALTLHGQLDAQERNLESQRKVVLSKLMMEWEGAATKGDAYAHAHPSYTKFLGHLMEIRSQCAEAKARVSYLQARLEVWRTRAATHRESMKRGNGYGAQKGNGQAG